MKSGAMNDANPSACVKNCGTLFLSRLIGMIKPKVIVTLGVVPAMSVLDIHLAATPLLGSLRRSTFGDVFTKSPIQLNDAGLLLFPMYHPGRLGQLNRKRVEQSALSGLDLMKADWQRMRMSLGW